MGIDIKNNDAKKKKVDVVHRNTSTTIRTRLTFIFILCKIISNAKDPYSDSLLHSLNMPSTALNQKYQLYSQIVVIVRMRDDYSMARKIVDQYISLSLQNKNYTETTKAYAQKALIYNNQSKYDSLQIYLDSVTTYAQMSKEPIANAYLRFIKYEQALSFLQNGKAIEECLKAIPDAETAKDYFLLNRLYYGLSYVYLDWDNLTKALHCAKKALEYGWQTKDKNNVSMALVAITDINNAFYDDTDKKQYMDTVLYYSKEAISLCDQYPNQISNYFKALVNCNMAFYLLQYNNHPDQNQRIQIRQYTSTSLDACKQSQNSQSIIANNYNILSKLAKLENNKSLEESYLLDAYSIEQKREPVANEILSERVQKLADFYTESRNFEKANHYQKLVTDYNSTYYDQEQMRIAKKFDAEFESAKKERQLKELQSMADYRRKQNYLYLGIIILVIVGSIYIFKSYRFKLRYSLSQQKQLELEKHEQEMQIKLEKEESARLKTEQELWALQQQRLQDEVLSNKLHVQHKNEILQQLKNKINQDETFDLNKVIRDENMVDDNFENTVFQIQEAHPNFFKNLNEKSKYKLTPLDLKYCAYIYLGMNAKQIGNLLAVEAKSVRMTKYRIKQKIGLGIQEDLDIFLKSLS